jgi:hypothetical protein
MLEQLCLHILLWKQFFVFVYIYIYIYIYIVYTPLMYLFGCAIVVSLVSLDHPLNASV